MVGNEIDAAGALNEAKYPRGDHALRVGILASFVLIVISAVFSASSEIYWIASWSGFFGLALISCLVGAAIGIGLERRNAILREKVALENRKLREAEKHRQLREFRENKQ